MDTTFGFTKVTLDALPLPEAGKRSVYYDERQPGLQLRVTAKGVKTFSVFGRVSGGKPERVSIGRYPAITPEVARKKAKAIIAQLAVGTSPNAIAREGKAPTLTLAVALTEYVETQTRDDDGLPLKPRTKADYLAMVKPSRVTAAGKSTKGGLLRKLAGKSIHAITAAEIKTVNADNKMHRGERQSAYALQVLKAVLNFYGVKIKDSPFSLDTPKAGRVTIPKTRAADDAPVTKLMEHLGHFWRALSAVESPVGDYLRFLLLTGCRPGEPLIVPVADCDLVKGKVLLRDTKTRTDHTLWLSTQVLEIVKRNVEGKSPEESLFAISNTDAHALAHELVAATGLAFTPKTLRAVFASIASDLVTVSTYRRIMNRGKGSVDDKNYIKKMESQLRDGWQKVADYIEATSADNVVPLFKLN
ncbi:Phage integrase family protein [Pseudomonas arsenicoxydans]|uniref:Phage integrase family protein n=1 Tax=Pseudomonas arsenicoxydans TaxID=702115 RepID=A0A1H0HKB8_9PSED|nr:integrase family protein [Pseudomonas arsenicoxydans]SDO19646.1 Phage integrase family protein [Pseudomonas arsenicoxydans]